MPAQQRRRASPKKRAATKRRAPSPQRRRAASPRKRPTTPRRKTPVKRRQQYDVVRRLPTKTPAAPSDSYLGPIYGVRAVPTAKKPTVELERQCPSCYELYQHRVVMPCRVQLPSGSTVARNSAELLRACRVWPRSDAEDLVIRNGRVTRRVNIEDDEDKAEPAAVVAPQTSAQDAARTAKAISDLDALQREMETDRNAQEAIRKLQEFERDMVARNQAQASGLEDVARDNCPGGVCPVPLQQATG